MGTKGVWEKKERKDIELKREKVDMQKAWTGIMITAQRRRWSREIGKSVARVY